jgi:hypothetical protein
MPVSDNPASIVGGPASAKWNDWQTVFEAPDFASPNEAKPKSDENLARWNDWQIMFEAPGFASQDEAKPTGDEKLEKNSDLVQDEYVDKRTVILSILESGKSKEEIVDLLTVLFESSASGAASKNRIDFEAVSKVEGGRPVESIIIQDDMVVTLPDAAPELFEITRGRPKKGNDIVSFLRRVWKDPWIDAGVLTRADLSRLDPAAYLALNNHLRHSELPDDLKIPTLSENFNSIIPPDLAAFVKNSDEKMLRAIRAIAERELKLCR